MNLDLDQLGCGHSDLLDFLYILRRVRPSHVYMLAMYDKLMLATTTGDITNSVDQVTISVPYSGKRSEGFVPIQEFAQALRSTQGVLVFQTSDKPTAWPNKLPPRQRELKNLNARNIHQSLEYLLRIQPSAPADWWAGLIFTKGELLTTDGKRMHIDNSQPNMIEFTQLEQQGDLEVSVPGRVLMGLGAASALMRATRLMPSASVIGGYQHLDAATRGFYFELKHGKTVMAVTSRPWIQTRSTAKARPPGDERNAAFTVYRDHLETVLKAARQQLKKKEIGTVTLTHEIVRESPVLRVKPRASWNNEYGVAQVRDMEHHDLICSPGQGFQPGRWVELNTEFLLDATQGLGPHIQFILPAHPVDGLEHCYVNPVYVTGIPGRFAVLSPCCDTLTSQHVFNLRRTVDTRTANNDSRPSV